MAQSATASAATIDCELMCPIKLQEEMPHQLPSMSLHRFHGEARQGSEVDVYIQDNVKYVVAIPATAQPRRQKGASFLDLYDPRNPEVHAAFRGDCMQTSPSALLSNGFDMVRTGDYWFPTSRHRIGHAQYVSPVMLGTHYALVARMDVPLDTYNGEVHRVKTSQCGARAAITVDPVQFPGSGSEAPPPAPQQLPSSSTPLPGLPAQQPGASTGLPLRNWLAVVSGSQTGSLHTRSSSDEEGRGAELCVQPCAGEQREELSFHQLAMSQGRGWLLEGLLPSDPLMVYIAYAMLELSMAMEESAHTQVVAGLMYCTICALDKPLEEFTAEAHATAIAIIAMRRYNPPPLDEDHAGASFCHIARGMLEEAASWHNGEDDGSLLGNSEVS